jgi:hypothetical protein
MAFQALAESGMMTLRATKSLVAADRAAETNCEAVKSQVNCSIADDLLKQNFNLSVAACQAQKKSADCGSFFTKFPQYKDHEMSCSPYDICRTALNRTMAQGCLRYGVKMKDGFLAALGNAGACIKSAKCLEGEVSQTFEYLSNPLPPTANWGANMYHGVIRQIHDDGHKLDKIACLDPDTQAEFSCYLVVQYGGAVMAAAGLAEAGTSVYLARMARLNADLSTLAAEDLHQTGGSALRPSVGSGSAGSEFAAVKNVPKLNKDQLDFNVPQTTKNQLHFASNNDTIGIANLDGQRVFWKEMTPTKAIGEAQMLKRLNDLGVGIPLKGIVDLGNGNVAMVTDYFEGSLLKCTGINCGIRVSDGTFSEVSEAHVTQQTINEIRRVGKLLAERGIEANDLQFLIHDGHAVLIDPAAFRLARPGENLVWNPTLAQSQVDAAIADGRIGQGSAYADFMYYPYYENLVRGLQRQLDMVAARTPAYAH